MVKNKPRFIIFAFSLILILSYLLYRQLNSTNLSLSSSLPDVLEAFPSPSPSSDQLQPAAVQKPFSGLSVPVADTTPSPTPEEPELPSSSLQINFSTPSPTPLNFDAYTLPTPTPTPGPNQIVPVTTPASFLSN